MYFCLLVFLFVLSYIMVMKDYVFRLIVWLEIFILLCGELLLMTGVLRGGGGGLILIFIISFAVCEAVIALRCLVNISYCVENFNLKGLDIVKC